MAVAEVRAGLGAGEIFSPMLPRKRERERERERERDFIREKQSKFSYQFCMKMS